MRRRSRQRPIRWVRAGDLRAGGWVVGGDNVVTIVSIIGRNDVLDRLTVATTLGRLELKPFAKYAVMNKNSLNPPRIKRI